MKAIEIVGWNPINDGCGYLKPSVYVRPTLEMLRFFNRSVLHRGVVRVTGSNSCYDGPNRFATIDKSADVPNCRQNFYNGTGLYVITLDTDWLGYPMKNGDLEFQEGIVNDIVTYVNPQSNSLAPFCDTATTTTTSSPSALVETFQQDDEEDNDKSKEKIVTKDKNDSCAWKGMDMQSLILAGLVILFFLCNSMISRG